MAEYIERKAVFDKLAAIYDLARTNQRAVITDALREVSHIPAADVQPVQHGRWIAENRDNRGYADCYTCTNCNCYSYTYTLMKDCEYEYCPNCGAKMDGDAE